VERLKPFIKWAGGKEKELPIIIDNLPEKFARYVEPFVGGGSVYLAIASETSVINDKSDELMLLYEMIKKNNEKFLCSLREINNNWLNSARIYPRFICEYIITLTALQMCYKYKTKKIF
jgi:DNA adenine methylase